MKKLVLTYGLISGLIISVFMVTSMALSSCEHMDDNWAMFIGFASMIIAFSFIFVAVKNFRDNYGNGAVSFGKAFQIGLFISLIASTMYVVAWVIEYNFFMPDFMDKYGAHMIEKAKTSGATAAQIQAQINEVASMKEMYKNPVMMVLMTYAEIFPVGLIISIITALFLKKKPQQPMEV
ncbi:MAG TPA: DUF4199 domain-containing protein [Flavobacterium sp.]|nr:DUF4199 domain-containing protein [Flavobacterium sp.]